MPMPPLKVDPVDPQWRAVRQYIDARIAVLSPALEKRGMSVEDTEFIRGQLRELRTLAGYETGPAPRPATPDHIYS